MLPREQYLIRPGIRGSSGIPHKWASRSLLKAATEQSVLFLMRLGRLLNNRGPFTPMLQNRIVLMRQGAVALISGNLQYLPFLLLSSTWRPKFGTIPSRIFQTYMHTYRSLLLCRDRIFSSLADPNSQDERP